MPDTIAAHQQAAQHRVHQFLHPWRQRTYTFVPHAMHMLQCVSSDSTSVTVAVKTSVTPCWLLGGAALSVGAPLLPTQGSLRRSLVDGLRPPLTREPLRRPWAGWGQERACPMCRAAPEDGFAAPAAAGRGCGRGGEAAAGPGSAGCGPG